LKGETNEAFKASLAKVIEETRKAKGTLRYDMYEDSKEPGVLVFIETFSSPQYFEAYRNAEYIQTFMGELKNWLISEPEVRVLKPAAVAKK